MKKNLFKKIIVTGVVAFAPVMVNAESANISIVGDSKTYLNDTITLNVSVNNIKDVEDGIVAIGGDIIYDNNYLELVSATPKNTNYAMDGNIISNSDYRIAGVDYTMENGIKNDTIIYSLVFKANKLGETTISFINPDIVNTNAKNIDGTTTSKLVNIIAKEEVKEVSNQEEIKEVKTEEVKEVKIVDTKENKTEVLTSEEEVKNDVQEEIPVTEETKEEVEEDNVFVKIFASIIDFFAKIFR